MKAVRHVGIVVSNLGRSLQFYRDLLGMKVAKVADEAGEYLDSMLALKKVKVTTAKLSADGGTALVELLEFKSPRSDRTKNHTLYSIGPSHVAFTVEDLDDTYRRLTEKGVRFNAPPQSSPDGSVKVTFCEDPDGVPVELVQVLNP